MPGDNLLSHPGGGIRHLDDGIILPEIPDNTSAGEGAGEDVLDLSVPGHTSHIVQGLRLGPWSHWVAGLVHIPDVQLGLAAPAGQQVALERVEVQGGHGARVLVLGEQQGVVLALDQPGGVVHGDDAPVGAPHNEATGHGPIHHTTASPHQFVVSLVHGEGGQTWHVMTRLREVQPVDLKVGVSAKAGIKLLCRSSSSQVNGNLQ